MKDKVQLETTYPHPPERVWQALTDSAALSRWLLPTDFEPLIGYRFRFELPDGRVISGKVTDVESESRLAYTWRDEDEGEDSLVVWSIAPKDGGTHVRLEHVAIEEPAVTCIAVDSYFNWLYALRHSLPGMLILLSRLDSRPPRVPIVYVAEEEVTAK